ncbi:MAG: hypothetical protein ACYCW6_31500, partial [Candidatus Xenobia bacterium]
ARQVLQQTLPLDRVQARDYDAVFLPGGHGTMFDLPDNPTLGDLLGDFDYNSAARPPRPGPR